MKAKTTVLWLILAVSLAAFIWIFNQYFRPAGLADPRLLTGLRAAGVTGIHIYPGGAPEISVIHTNGAWQLQKPLAYPAQADGMQALLGELEKLVPITRLTASELHGHKNTEAEFGFENRQYSIAIEAGDERWQLLVGNQASANQVFVRVVGVDGIFVTDTAWLQALPRSANDWRDTALVAAADACDWIVITNGTKIIELRNNPTNHLWQIIQPLPARADGARIVAALQQLRAAHVTRFVSDDPKADLSTYGLQPAELDVWLGSGTNFLATVHAGKNLPDNASQIYARRGGWNSVLAVDKDALAAWRVGVNDFREAQLLTPTAPVAEIEVRGENNFTLQQRGTNAWAVAGEKFPADPENVQAFLKLLTGLRATEFVKDNPTAATLRDFGLATPVRQVTLRAVPGATNAGLGQLLFGIPGTNQVFVKRSDEPYVYAVTPEAYNSAFLCDAGWFYRDRHIWNFSPTNVTQITARQNGQTRQLLHRGLKAWSLAPGSQGLIDSRAVEQTLGLLANLEAIGWVGRNITAPEKYGLRPDNLQLTIELKSGEKFAVDFGAEVQGQTALAAVTLDGERWAFIFPVIPYQMVVGTLTLPPATP